MLGLVCMLLAKLVTVPLPTLIIQCARIEMRLYVVYKMIAHT